MGASEVIATAERPLALVLFGSPGSGKGTQSKLLVEWLRIPQISTGDMLREHIRLQDEVGQAISQLMRAGSLVPDDLVNRLVAERIAQPDCSRGFILDGYPRTLAQAKQMLGLLKSVGAEEVVIHLIVDYNVIISRIAGRRACPRCGTLYNNASRPPKTEGKCDLDGETLVVRDDDREDVVRRRLEQYDEQTRPVVEFYQKDSHRLIEVDASRDTPETIFGKIRAGLETLVTGVAH